MQVLDKLVGWGYEILASEPRHRIKTVKRIEVRQIGIPLAVRVSTKLNGDIK